jgi:hypothetical protein
VALYSKWDKGSGKYTKKGIDGKGKAGIKVQKLALCWLGGGGGYHSGVNQSFGRFLCRLAQVTGAIP